MKAAKKNVNIKHLLEDYRCTPITLNHNENKNLSSRKNGPTRESTICQLINATADETFAISLNNWSGITKF